MPAQGPGNITGGRRARRPRRSSGSRPETAGNPTIARPAPRASRPSYAGNPNLSGVRPAPRPAAPRPTTNVFTTRPSTRPYAPAQHQAARRTTRARSRLPDHPAVVHFPVLSSYTPAQIRTIHRAYSTGARRAGVRSIRELYALASPRQQRNMMAVSRAVSRSSVTKQIVRQNLVDGQLRAGPHKSTGTKLLEGGRSILPLAAFSVPGTATAQHGSKTLGDLLKTGARYGVEAPAATVYNLGRATVEDPAGVASSSLRTAKESITGIPQAVGTMVHEVQQHGLRQGVTVTLKAMAQDYEKRYGSILSNPAKFREQVKKDYGLTPFVMDAAALGAGGGQVLGAASRMGAVERAAAALTNIGDRSGIAALQASARQARAFSRMTTRDRPGLRYSGGEAGVKRQATSRNFITAAAQHSLDKARERAFAHQRERAHLEEGPGGRLITRRGAQGYHEGERMTALRPGDNEVVARYGARYGRMTLPSARELPTLRRYTGRAARDLGGSQSKTRLRLLTHRGRVLNEVEKQMRKLNPDESRALKYMLQLGVKPGEDGVRALSRRLAQITRNRRGRNVSPILESTNDEVRLIREILKDPERFITSNSRKVADELRTVQLREAANDPALQPDQELIRRVTPQGKLLGIQRGPDAGFFRGVLQDLERRTEQPGLAAHADELAGTHPSQRAAAARDIGGALSKDVSVAERAVETARRREQAWSSVIREREQRGKPLSSAEVQDARAELAGARSDHRDALNQLQTARRRDAVLRARLTERDRAGTALATPPVLEARGRVSEAQRELNRLQSAIGGTERRAGRAIGEATSRSSTRQSVESAWFRPNADAKRPVHGRGTLDANGRLHTWTEAEGSHLDVARARQLSGPREDFTIRPDGTISIHGGSGRMTDFEVMARAVVQDPRLKIPESIDRRIDAPGPMDSAGVEHPNFAQTMDRIIQQYRPARLAGETRGRNARALEAEGQSVHLDAQLRASKDLLRARQQELKAIERAAPRVPRDVAEQTWNTSDAVEAAALRVTGTEAAVKAAKTHLQETLLKAPRVTEASYQRLQNLQNELNAARQTRDAVREFEGAFRHVVRAAASKSTMRLEDAHTFATKVQKAADEAGLTDPAYWWSSMRPQQMPSLAAAGRGLAAGHRDRHYTGSLFDVGAEEHGADVFTRGVERNIKRRFQQALVYRNLETHAYEWSRGHDAAGMTIPELKRAMDERYIDPNSIELIDAKVIQRRPNEQQGVERGQVLTGEAHDQAVADGEDFVTTTQQTLAAVRRQWRDVTPDELRGLAQSRYLAVPREVGETLDGVANRMDSPGWRAAEIVLKQKPARILLGAANIPWLTFQVASNALLTGLGGGVHPLDVYGAAKWFRSLSHEERDAIEAELGITHGHHFAMDETNLGASNRRMVNTWRAMKKTRVGRLGHKANPLNIMFRADEAQNNFFRRVLFYSKSRRASYERMGRAWRGIDSGITRLTDHVLAQPPERQMALIAKHGQAFEDVAKHVRDFLGDYTTYTPSERFLLSRNVMFYGYLRFSLRFAFHTMPVGHPIMTAIMGNLGRLGAQEIKDLFGVPSDFNLPATMLAQTYFGDRKDAKHGRLRAINFGRFNPFLNSLTQLDGAQQAFGLVSPVYQGLVDQAFEESSFTGRDWRIEGRSNPSPSEMPSNYYGSMASLLNPAAYSIPGHAGAPRNRIFESQMLDLLYPYRAASTATMAPNQSDDALLWQPEPMRYADPTARAGIRASRRQAARQGTGSRILDQAVPFRPRITAAPQVEQRELERRKAIAARDRRRPGTRKPRKRSSAVTSYSGGSGGSYSYGGSSSSSGSLASRYGG